LGNTFDAPDGEGTWCPQPAQPGFFDDFKAAGFSDAIWDDGGDMWIYDRKSHRWNPDIRQAVFPAASAANP
jgi:hypothetical protein